MRVVDRSIEDYQIKFLYQKIDLSYGRERLQIRTALYNSYWKYLYLNIMVF